jgi:hypothetical protein
MRGSIPFHITPPRISALKESATPRDQSAGIISASATQVSGRVPPRSSSSNLAAEKSRKPRISAPAMCTMRKVQVSIGSEGSSGRFTAPPVMLRIESPFSAAMWKAA